MNGKKRGERRNFYFVRLDYYYKTIKRNILQS